jgi:hypothetical protein
MGVGGQLHDPTNLPPWKELSALLGKETGYRSGDEEKNSLSLLHAEN